MTKTIVNLWIWISTICMLFYSWQWYNTQNPQYEPKIALIGAASALVALWFKSDGGKGRNSASFIGNRNKITQENHRGQKENTTGFIGSENEVNQK